MKFIKLFKIAVVGLVLEQGQAFASTSVLEQCIDPKGKFLLQKFIPSGSGDSGSMRFIDMFNRQIVDLFCGYDRDVENRVEIACVSSHFGNTNFNNTIRVRVHRQAIASLPQIALLEIQSENKPMGSINDVIPMACK